MSLKNDLIKAGFEDHTALTDAWGNELEFELCANLPRTKQGMGNIRIRKLNTSGFHHEYSAHYLHSYSNRRQNLQIISR